MTRAVPWCTVLVATLTLLAWASPAVSAALLYDRALVNDGQLWRLATSALVHWTPRHLLLDLAVVAAAGAALERMIGSRLLAIVALSAAATGVAVHFASPSLDRYAGLSGVACTLVALIAIVGLDGTLWQRMACLTTLCALLVKLALDTLADAPVFLGATEGFVTATASHAAGIALAFALALRPANFLGGLPRHEQ